MIQSNVKLSVKRQMMNWLAIVSLFVPLMQTPLILSIETSWTYHRRKWLDYFESLSGLITILLPLDLELDPPPDPLCLPELLLLLVVDGPTNDQNKPLYYSLYSYTL